MTVLENVSEVPVTVQSRDKEEETKESKKTLKRFMSTQATLE